MISFDNNVEKQSTVHVTHDYPNTYREFVTMFFDNKACATYLEKLRWPHGFICPSCKTSSIPWYQTRNRLVCPYCRHQTSVCTGTIYDKTRTPLTTWFEAAWLLTTAKNGISAKTLERTLGISYRVAWAILQRFRVSMVRAEREKLSGEVEVDETYVGGVEKGSKCGRGTDKCIVVIAIELKSPKGFGRVRMRNVPDAFAANLMLFIRDVVEIGSIIRTDGWPGYNDLPRLGYKHEKTILSFSDYPAHVSMPGVHRLSALLKRWLLGTHHGSFRQDHLQSYLEEYTFRFNRRTSKSRGLIFHRLLEQSVRTGPITEADVTYGYEWRKHPYDKTRRS